MPRARASSWGTLPHTVRSRGHGMMARSAVRDDAAREAGGRATNAGDAALPARKLAGLRAACTTATWGAGRRTRCQELHSCLLVKGHRADPRMALTYQRLAQLRRWCKYVCEWHGLPVPDEEEDE